MTSWPLIPLLTMSISVAACADVVDTQPTATPCAEVVRIPAADSRFAPNVLSLAPGAARVALSVRTATVDDLKDVLKVYETATKHWVEPAIRVAAGEELQSLIF